MYKTVCDDVEVVLFYTYVLYSITLASLCICYSQLWEQD